MMIRILALLCLSFGASSAFFKEKDTKLSKNLRVTFSANPLDLVLKRAFTELPQTKAAALKEKWVEVPRPIRHEEFSSLKLLCPQGDYLVCLLYDDTDYVAGMQIAFGVEEFSGSIYDWTTQGFIEWTVDNDGESEVYWATQMYFSSPEYLQTNADTRINLRSNKTLLQDKYIYVSGINGKLHPIPTDVVELADTATSNFTEQACMIFMGRHYYYQMTKDLPCNDQLFPFFPIVYNNQLVAIGFVGYGLFEPKKNRTNRCEKPDSFAVKLIVPRGPQCLYDLAKKPGLVTMHTYFIDNPTSILCQ